MDARPLNNVGPIAVVSRQQNDLLGLRKTVSLRLHMPKDLLVTRKSQIKSRMAPKLVKALRKLNQLVVSQEKRAARSMRARRFPI